MLNLKMETCNLPSPKDPSATCARKRRHSDEITARAFALTAIDAGWNKNKPECLYVYKCPVCRGWHLTRFKVSVPVKSGNAYVN